MTEAKQAVDELLEQLGLEAYLFSVEPAGKQWQVKVERPADGRWQTAVLTASDAALLSSRSDPAARHALLERWRERLGL